MTDPTPRTPPEADGPIGDPYRDRDGEDQMDPAAHPDPDTDP